MISSVQIIQETVDYIEEHLAERLQVKDLSQPLFIEQLPGITCQPGTSKLDQSLRLEGKARTSGSESLPIWAKLNRCFTRAQVCAMKVVIAFEPPPGKPEDFGA